MTAEAELTARDFERRFQELLRRAAGAKDNEACVECARCKGCIGSTFCQDSSRLVRCHFCVRCESCTDCSHCRGSRQLIGCQHCIDCDGCLHGSYLVRCVSLTSCQYCFGCVGLSGKDFHVLNQPYDRRTYFSLTRRLSEELGW